MASLSNINGLFDVHSTGAILFSNTHGTSGQILRSNGNAAPTWVDSSTVIGGPYLPLTGGTLTGPLSGTSATFSGDLTVTGNQYFNGSFIEGDGKEMFRYSDSWLRINEDNDFASGIYCGTGILRTDGQFEVGSAGTKFKVTSAGVVTALGNITAPSFNGLAINTTGTNNVANQIVRTQGNGYVNFGWINTISGGSSGTITRIYASQDAYIRYMTPTTFRTQITDPYYAPASTVSGVTSVATGNGITGGTITTTGTVSLTGSYTGRWNGTTGYFIKDTRAGDITPVDSTDYAMNLGFTNQVPGNSNWQSYIQMKGWSDGYTSWQIIGPSTTTAYENWYLRSGKGTTWNTAKEIWHTGNLTSSTVPGGPYLPLAGGTVTGSTDFTAGTYPLEVYGIGSTQSSSAVGLGIYGSSTAGAIMHFHRPGAYAVNFGLDSDNIMRIGGWSANANRWFLDMNGNNTVAGSFRAPIFYDSLNTLYYGDFGGTTMGKYFGRQAHNEGFQVGSYNNVGENSTRSNPIYTIGSSYMPASTTLSSMYGIGYTHKNASFISMVGRSGWGMYVAADGNARVWLDGSSGRVAVTGAMYAPIYYDTNTAYYADFSSTSRLNTLNCDGVITSGTSSTGNIYCGNAGSTHFRFHTVSNTTYFDMNSGTIQWRQGSSTRFYFYPSTANMTINGTLTQNSDIRIKENVIEINDCISKVQGMRGVYYNRTDFNTEVTKVGVIAQEVEAVLPELILENEESGLKSVAYSELTAVLINAIKEQQVIIDDLKSRIEKLEL
jgi:hypothetical protein